MRVLQVHKFFYPHAGSETVLFHTSELLREAGHDVVEFAMRDPRNSASDYQGDFARSRSYTSGTRLERARDAMASIYSPEAGRRLRDLAGRTKPDVVHFHLVYHQLTMATVEAVHRLGIPSVMTLHDYKIGCPAHVLYREGRPCEACLDGSSANVVRHKCIKDSRAASAIAFAEAVTTEAMGSYDKVDIYIGPSRFATDIAQRSGIPRDRLRVIPNFLPETELAAPAQATSSRPSFFYAGRLEPEKGLLEMLEAFDDSASPPGVLRIAGAGGSLEDDVRRRASQSAHITFLGRLERSTVLQELQRATAALAPSRWYENNPMSVLEARAVGTPVIVSDQGGLPEMVTDGEDGLVVPAGDASALRLAAASLANDRGRASRMGDAGRRRLATHNSSAVHYAKLLEAYGAAVDRRRALSG